MSGVRGVCIYRVDVQIRCYPSQQIAVEKLARVVQTVLQESDQPQNAGVTLVIVDDESIRQLNRAFRGIDRATDVLSFGICDDSRFVVPDELPTYLGDVVISYDRASEQSTERGHSLEDELALLAVHGCLHLLGYDDATEEKRERMWARQRAILDSLR